MKDYKHGVVTKIKCEMIETLLKLLYDDLPLKDEDEKEEEEEEKK